MTKTTKLNRPPSGHELGGVDPQIAALADLAKAVETLSWLTTTAKAIDAEAEAQINRIRSEATAKKTIVVDDEPIGFDQRIDQVSDAAKAFVAENADVVFADGLKTAQFPCGTVAMRDKPPCLQFDKGVTGKSVKDEVVEEEQLLPKITAWLKRLGLLNWIRLKPEFDSQGLTAACKAGQVTAAELAEYGLRFEGGDEVTIKPADYAAATSG